MSGSLKRATAAVCGYDEDVDVKNNNNTSAPSSNNCNLWSLLGARPHIDQWAEAVQAAADAAPLARLSTMLEFVEQLEKHVYHAYEGCVALDFGGTPAAELFFTANRKTCDDWFARTRGALLAAALAGGATAEAAHHGSRRLRDVQESLGAPSLPLLARKLVTMDSLQRSRTEQLLGAVLVQVRERVKKN